MSFIRSFVHSFIHAVSQSVSQSVKTTVNANELKPTPCVMYRNQNSVYADRALILITQNIGTWSRLEQHKPVFVEPRGKGDFVEVFVSFLQ